MTDDSSPKPVLIFTNAAARLLQTLRGMRNMPNKKQFALGFVSMFGDPQSSDAHELAAESARRLALLVKELEIVGRELSTQAIFPEATWLSHHARLKQVLRSFVTYHNTEWSSISGNIDDATLTHVMYWADILPKNDVVLSGESLAELRAALTELEALSGRADIPLALRAVIIEQVSIFKQAIVDYAIRGGRAFSDVLLNAANDLAQHKATCEASRDSDGVTGLVRFWTVFNRTIEPINQAFAVVNIIRLAQGVPKLLGG